MEDRIDNGTKLGKVIKKIIFGDIYANRKSLFQKNPLTQELQCHLQVTSIALSDPRSNAKSFFLV